MKTALNLDKVENSGKFTPSILQSIKNSKMILHLRSNEEEKAGLLELKEFIKNFVDFETKNNSNNQPSAFKNNKPGAHEYIQSLIKEKLKKIDDEYPPKELTCNISFVQYNFLIFQDLFENPVTTVTGQTYEKDQIIAHFRVNGSKDPNTRQTIANKPFFQNNSIKKISEKWREK